MDKNELLSLEKGQFVMYCGKSDYVAGIIQGNTFEVTLTGDIGFRISSVETECAFVVTEHDKRETRCTKYYKVVPKWLPEESDKTELKATDYELLIDYALEINDFNWVRELHAARQKVAI